MSINKTGIQWTDFTANPIRFRNRESGEPVTWACVKVSDGCKNCYAETLALRYGKGAAYTVGNMLDLDPVLDEKVIHEMLTSKKLSGHKVFLGDMTDLFGAWVPDWMIIEIWAVAAVRPDVTLQLLTKRPERAKHLIATYRPSGPGPFSQRVLRRAMELKPDLTELPWPLPNVWLGTSVENQTAADERIPHLLATPAAVRFLSCEPLLGPLDLDSPVGTAGRKSYPLRLDETMNLTRYVDAPWARIDWVIVGGESGPHARPCNEEWIRSIVRQCHAAAVPVFVKQLGSRPYDPECPHLSRDGVLPLTSIGGNLARQVWHCGECGGLIGLRSRHGSDPEEWPEDLRVREFPEVRR